MLGRPCRRASASKERETIDHCPEITTCRHGVRLKGHLSGSFREGRSGVGEWVPSGPARADSEKAARQSSAFPKPLPGARAPLCPRSAGSSAGSFIFRRRRPQDRAHGRLPAVHRPLDPQERLSQIQLEPHRAPICTKVSAAPKLEVSSPGPSGRGRSARDLDSGSAAISGTSGIDFRSSPNSLRPVVARCLR